MQCTIQKPLKAIKIEPDCEVVRVVDGTESTRGHHTSHSGQYEHSQKFPTTSHQRHHQQVNQKILLSPRTDYHLSGGKNYVLISDLEQERNQQRQISMQHQHQHGGTTPSYSRLHHQQSIIHSRQQTSSSGGSITPATTTISKCSPLPSTQQVRVIKDGRFYDETRQNSSEHYHTETEHLNNKTITFLPKNNKNDDASHHHVQQQHHQQHHHQQIIPSLPPPATAAASGSRKYLSSRHVNVISTNSNSNINSNSNSNTTSNNNTNNKSDMCNSVSNHSHDDNNSALFRTPIVSSSSSPMRPPPPPPPPKVKSFTSSSTSSGCTTSSSSSHTSSGAVSNNEEPSSSIPDLEFDGTTVLCRVCGDKASGFHYGVHSCEGCKGFFRRSIQQKIQYRPCTKNQQCSILRINRNRCQYCRLKKCIAVGMSRDAVRFGRVPKREKARILAAMQQSSQNRGQQRALATELDDQPRLLAAVLRAHMETCEFTKDKVAAMRQRARECPSFSMPTLLACPLNPAPELQSEQEFSQRFAHVIRGVIDFAGMIPGFQLLTQDDKFTLLKAGLFDALFVRLICMFDSSINSIICLNGQVMRRDAIQNGANARFLVDSTFNFAKRMNSMNLSDAEIGLFCAIVLITPDRPGLRNVELIEKMYSRLKACLQSVISQNRPDQPDFMLELLKTLPDLRTLSTLHTEKLVVFRTEHKEMLRQHMWTMDDDHTSKSPRTNLWDSNQMEDIAKSPMGSVSSTESGDIEYSPSSLASSAPLLAATLSGTCPLRDRANSGSSAEDDIIGSHAHLTQNGLTITPIASRSHSQPHSHLASRYRKLDSPTDSGIESGNEKAESTKALSSGGSSSCSSPRSSVDDILDEHNAAASHGQNLSGKRQTVDDMPVLKRVLQAPPLYDTNSLMDEAYKPHKKFRALRHREVESTDPDVHTTQVKYSPSAQHQQQQQQQHQQQQQQYQSPTQSQLTASPSPTSSSLSPPSGTGTGQGASSSSTPPLMTSASSSPSSAGMQHQSQLHMHLLKGKLNSNNNHNNNNNNNNNNNSSNSDNLSQNQNSHQTQYSSLSSTHSVLAKSLMEEPRMTPEQIKRTDIIQNYIMREQSNSSIVCNANSQSQQQQQQHSHYSASSSSSNSNCASPSTTVVFTPPPSQSHSMRWQGHSVITTTPMRQQTPSPNNMAAVNGGSVTVTSNGRYLQSPHSTSVSPPCPSPSGQSPRLLELQVDIADSQQPLNLSKKSPTPPPSQPNVKKSLNLPNSFPLSADVTVTAAPAVVTTATPQVHKVLLEA